MKLRFWHTKVILILTCAIAYGITSVSAQEDPFTDGERETVKRVYKSPMNSRGEYGWLSEFMDTPWKGLDSLDPSGGGGAVADGEPAEEDPAPETRERLGIMYGPMEGFADTMKAPVYKNLAKNLLTSPIAVFNTTLLLTEPGIGTGLSNAIIESNGWLQHRYLAEQQFATQMQFYSEFGNSTMQSYYHCLSKYAKENSDGGAPTSSVAGTKTGWIKAHDHCFIDKDASLGSESDNKNDFEDPDTEMFQLVSMLGGDDEGSPDPGDPLGGEDKVFLTQILFGKGNSSGDPAAPSDITGGGGDGQEKIREAFQQMIGDVEYYKETGGSGGSGGAPSGGGSSAFEMKWKLRLPGVDGAPGIKYSEQLSNIEEEMFENIMNLLRKKCNFLKNTNNIKPFQKPKFWKGDENGSGGGSSEETPTDEEIMKVSVFGFQFPPALGDILYNIFNVKSSSLGEGENREQVCNEVFGVEAAPGTNGNFYQELVGNPKKVGTEHRVVLSIARRLAYIRWLGIMSQAYSAVMENTGAVTELPTVKHAVYLILLAAGTDDIEDTRLQVLNELKGVIQRLAAYQQTTSGNMGEDLTQGSKEKKE